MKLECPACRARLPKIEEEEDNSSDDEGGE